MAPTSDTRQISGASGSDQDPSLKRCSRAWARASLLLIDSWRLTASNSGAETILGAPSAEIVGDLLWDVLPQIRGTEFERRCRLVMEKRTREEFEIYSALRPHRYHEVRAFPFGADVGVAFRDITDRERDTQRLRDRAIGACPGPAHWRRRRVGRGSVAMASAVNAHQNISIFMASRQTPSTTRMSSGSRAFTRKTESELRRTSWRQSQAPIKNIRLNIA